MFKCLDCGYIYSEDQDCPSCDSANIEEGEKCCRCGEWVSDISGKNIYCDDCLKEEATSDNAIKIGQKNKRDVEINGFLAYMFSSSQIEWMIIKYLIENTEFANSQAESYCFEDKSDFMDWVANWENE